MTNIKGSQKALKQSKTRRELNNSIKSKIKTLLRSLKTNGKTPDILNENYKELQSVLDKASKNKVIHKNKAARLKSRIAKLANAKPDATRKSGTPKRTRKTK